MPPSELCLDARNLHSAVWTCEQCALPCAQALLASLVPYRKDPQGAVWDNFQGLAPEPPVVLFRCTRTAWVMHHRDLADAAANPELFANEREPPTYHRYSATHSVRPLT